MANKGKHKRRNVKTAYIKGMQNKSEPLSGKRLSKAKALVSQVRFRQRVEPAKGDYLRAREKHGWKAQLKDIE